MTTVDIRPFEEPDAATIARLSTTVQWPSLTNAEVVTEVCTAPGSVAYVALSATKAPYLQGSGVRHYEDHAVGGIVDLATVSVR